MLFFQSGLQILREYFSDLLSLAEILLRSPDPSVSSYACEMYKLSFISFDLYCQQVYFITGLYLTLEILSVKCICLLLIPIPSLVLSLALFSLLLDQE